MCDIYKYFKGSVWWMNEYQKSSKPQRGITDTNGHMVVIISEASNPMSTCTLSVLPISSCSTAENHNKEHEFYLVPVHIYKDCYVQCNQPQTIVSKDLGRYVGQFSGDVIDKIDKELQRYLKMNVKLIIPEESNKGPAFRKLETLTCEIDIIEEKPKEEHRKSTKTVKKSTTKTTSEKKKGRSIPVYCESTGETYSSIKEASETLCIPRTYITQGLKCHGPVYGGYRFCYLSEMKDKIESL